jgi:hypothetical protein
LTGRFRALLAIAHGKLSLPIAFDVVPHARVAVEAGITRSGSASNGPTQRAAGIEVLAEADELDAEMVELSSSSTSRKWRTDRAI